MKHLVIVTDNFLPRWDGISRFLSEIIPRLKEDYEITVIAPNFKGRVENLGVNVVRVPISRITVGDFPVPKTGLAKQMRVIKKADLVWSQTIGPVGFTGIFVARMYRKPVIAYVHSIESELAAKSIKRGKVIKGMAYNAAKFTGWFSYNLCRLILVPSAETGEILRLQRVTREKRVVHLGIDTEKFVPPDSKAEAKKALGLSEDSFVIGYCGRIGREKDLVTLLRAFLRVRRQYKNARLLIIGGGVKDVEDLLRSKRGVIVTGFQDNVVPYLQALDVYVLPSLTETTSLSTMEAMSCAVPVVVTPVGKIPEYVSDGVNGFLFKKTNTYDCAKKIIRLYQDEELRIKMGNKGREKMIKEYSWEKTVHDIKKVLGSF